MINTLSRARARRSCVRVGGASTTTRGSNPAYILGRDLGTWPFRREKKGRGTYRDDRGGLRITRAAR